MESPSTLGAGDGDGDGEGPGDGPGDGPGEGPGDGPGDGPGEGPGDGPGEGPGIGVGTGQYELAWHDSVVPTVHSSRVCATHTGIFEPVNSCWLVIEG